MSTGQNWAESVLSRINEIIVGADGEAMSSSIMLEGYHEYQYSVYYNNK